MGGLLDRCRHTQISSIVEFTLRWYDGIDLLTRMNTPPPNEFLSFLYTLNCLGNTSASKIPVCKCDSVPRTMSSLCNEIKVSSSKTLLVTPQKLTIPIKILLEVRFVSLGEEELSLSSSSDCD